MGKSNLPRPNAISHDVTGKRSRLICRDSHFRQPQSTGSWSLALEDSLNYFVLERTLEHRLDSRLPPWSLDPALTNTTTRRPLPIQLFDMAASSPLIQSSAFAKLPRELLDGIASFLPTRDFNNLRLSCKQVENLLFPYWANCFFTVRQFMISDFSLNALLAISRHPVLSTYLSHLAIGLDDLDAEDVRSPEVTELDDLVSYHSERSSQQRLLYSGEAVHLLSTALANLPNLEYVDIRNYSSPTRYRDGACWTSYGSSAYSRLPQYISALGEGSRRARMDITWTSDDFISRVFRVLITALGQASSSRKSPVRRLDLIIKGVNALKDDAFALGRAPDPALCTVLNGLTTLHLNLSFRARTYGLQVSGHTEIQHNFSTFHLQKFLTLTPNLVWLRLNTSNAQERRPAMDAQVSCAFFSWLALQPGETPKETSHGSLGWREMPIEPIALPLKRLDLGACKLPIQLWTSLLQKYNGLEHLSLVRAIGYRKRDDTSTSGSPQDSLWAELIRALPGITPGLKHIQLVRLMEGDSPNNLHDVIFVEGIQRPREQMDRDIADKDGLEEIAASTMLDSVYYAKMKDQETGQAGSDDGDDDDGSGDHSDMSVEETNES